MVRDISVPSIAKAAKTAKTYGLADFAAAPMPLTLFEVFSADFEVLSRDFAFVTLAAVSSTVAAVFFLSFAYSLEYAVVSFPAKVVVLPIIETSGPMAATARAVLVIKLFVPLLNSPKFTITLKFTIMQRFIRMLKFVDTLGCLIMLKFAEIKKFLGMQIFVND